MLYGYEYIVLGLLIVILCFGCKSQVSKAKYIISLLYLVNDSKKVVNKLLVNIKDTDSLHILFKELYFIILMNEAILDKLNENTTTQFFRDELLDDNAIINSVINELKNMYYLSESSYFTNTSAYHCMTRDIMKLYRPSYLKIHHVISVDDIIL